VGQGADSLIFIVIAFVGTVSAANLLRVVLAQWLVKSAYETVATPLTYVIVRFLKRTEREDYYDYKTDFSPFRLKE